MAIFPWLGAFVYWAASFFLARMLISIGVGWITFTGIVLIYNEITEEVTRAWAQVDGTTFQLLSLAGIPDAIGILLGAIGVKVTMMSLSRLGRVAE